MDTDEGAAQLPGKESLRIYVNFQNPRTNVLYYTSCVQMYGL